MAIDVVGRDEELSVLAELADASRDGPIALVLDGDPGIGKSTLWQAGVDLAVGAGLKVLASRPAEAERGLAYAGLGDLLEADVDNVLPTLSPPRRRALEGALLRDIPVEPVDERALAVAVRDALRLLAEEAPIVVAIDDVQWLDGPTSSALAFAVRRLGSAPLLVLLARRSTDGVRRVETALDRALGSERARRLHVGPLSAGAVHRVLRDRLGRSFPRQTLLRIHERSAGNPLFALEIARALPEDVDPLAPLPVPETLEELLRARLDGLPTSTRDALALTAALGTSSERVLAGITDLDALGPAVAAQVVERDGGVVRFAHPLLASAVYRGLGDARCDVHARLAGVLDDPLLRARHVALSRDSPDAAVAAELDRASDLARGRGAHAVAAELAEHALRLTPSEASEERARRTLAAARAHQRAGEWIHARALAGGLLDVGRGSARAEALVLLAELAGGDDSVSLLEEALRDETLTPSFRAVILCRLAWANRFRTSVDRVGAALELTERLGDDRLHTHALTVGAVLGWFRGTAGSDARLRQVAPHLVSALGGDRLVREGMQAVVNTLAPADARALLEREYREWHERDELRGARALWGLAWVELRAGRLELAAAHADRAHDIAIQYGLEVPQDHLPIAVVAVHRGELDVARMHSERALKLAVEQFGLRLPQHVAVLGLVALWSGDRPAAAARLDEADGRAAEMGWGEPSLRWWTPDHVELLLEQGELDAAGRLLGTWEEDAVRVGRASVLAHVLRCSGLVAAARGDVDAAVELLGEAVGRHEHAGDPYATARALLALGVVRRRARQKRPARDAIERAVETFERIGAAEWAARARAELGAVGGRRRAEGLTPAESRVALLVAEGRTNREVAAALFLGERTVASHLTHVYAKLGVRSRTELARRLGAAGGPGADKVPTF